MFEGEGSKGEAAEKQFANLEEKGKTQTLTQLGQENDWGNGRWEAIKTETG